LRFFDWEWARRNLNKKSFESKGRNFGCVTGRNARSEGFKKKTFRK
jgi:hypothetical protein